MQPIRTDTYVEYWFGEYEKTARKWDIEYFRKTFPEVVFRENKGQDHAEFFTLHPKEFCREIFSAARKSALSASEIFQRSV